MKFFIMVAFCFLIAAPETYGCGKHRVRRVRASSTCSTCTTSQTSAAVVRGSTCSSCNPSIPVK